LFGELKAQYKLSIVYHHFAAYHGKGPCDGHTGVFKQKVKRYVRAGRDINGIDDYLLVIGSVKNTRTIHIQPGEPCPDAKSVTGVKKLNRFEYHELGKVRCFRTSDCPYEQGVDRTVTKELSNYQAIEGAPFEEDEEIIITVGAQVAGKYQLAKIKKHNSCCCSFGTTSSCFCAAGGSTSGGACSSTSTNSSASRCVRKCCFNHIDSHFRSGCSKEEHNSESASGCTVC